MGAEGLAAIGGLAGLERLELEVRGTDAGEEGLAALQNLHALKYLALTGPGVNDATIRALAGLERLEDLNLPHVDISAEGLRFLVQHKARLAELGLCTDSITDEEVPLLLEFEALESLTLCGGGITRASVPYLIRLDTLKRLGLYGTKLERSDLDGFSDAHPNCKVWVYRSTMEIPLEDTFPVRRRRRRKG